MTAFALRKHKGWFNQPWLLQVLFKTIILYSRCIWEACRGHAICQEICNIQAAYQWTR